MRLTVFYWTSTKSRAKRRFISSFYRGFNWTSFVSNTNLFRIFLLYGKRTNFRKGGIMSNQCRTCQLRMVLLSLCITYTHVHIIPRLLMKDLVIWCQDTWYHNTLLTRHFIPSHKTLLTLHRLWLFCALWSDEYTIMANQNNSYFFVGTKEQFWRLHDCLT